MRSIKLENGFAVKVEENIFHNMRLIDALAASKKDGTELSNVFVMILGEEQREKLYEHIESNGDTVTVEMIGEIIKELSGKLGEDSKN